MDSRDVHATFAVALWILRPVLTRAMRAQLSSFELAIETARQPWPQKLDTTRQLAERYDVHPEQGLPRSFLDRAVGFLSPNWGLVELRAYLPTAGRVIAVRRVAIATIAVERYRRTHDGAPAPALDALVPEYLTAVPDDPFTGKPLLYRVTPNYYVIYSVDRNRTDEGGLLYGYGSGPESLTLNAAEQARRDLGIRIPLHSQR